MTIKYKIKKRLKTITERVLFNTCPLCGTESENYLWPCSFDEEEDPETTTCPACHESIELEKPALNNT